MPPLTCQEIIERLKDILATDESFKPKDKDIAKLLNLHPNTLAQAKFKNSIPYKAIMDFLESKNICINTFFYGSPPSLSAHTYEHYKILRLYAANASTGGGCVNEHITYSDVVFDTRILHSLNIQKCEIIIALGESMEGIICDRSLCLLDRSDTFIKNGKIFCVNTPNGLFIKHCFLKDKRLELISHNLAYAPLSFALDEISILGRVKGVVNPVF